MIDITIKYRFKNLEYIVADAKGNFYFEPPGLLHYRKNRLSWND